MKLFAAVIALGVSITTGLARAESVKFDILVVEASNTGTNVDPRLTHMRDAFKKKGFAFSNYSVAAEPSAAIPVKGNHQFALPNGKIVILSPTAIEPDGKISVHAEIRGLMEMTYSVANGGTNYLGAGAHGAAQVFLVIKHSRQK